MTLFKILVDGKSAHGGDLVWSLPTDNGDGTHAPGDWHRVEGTIQACKRGLHFTREPERWLKVGCAAYEAEGRGDADAVGDKTAYAEGRLLRPAAEAIPAYWRAAEAFVRDEIPAVPWFRPDGNPDPAWNLFLAPLGAAHGAAYDAAYGASYDAACDAARVAAYDAAYGAARGAARVAAYDAAYGAAYDAARVAALFVVVEIVCADLPLEQRHRDHVRARWSAWRNGYGVAADVGGVLFCYGVQS